MTLPPVRSSDNVPPTAPRAALNQKILSRSVSCNENHSILEGQHFHPSLSRLIKLAERRPHKTGSRGDVVGFREVESFAFGARVQGASQGGRFRTRRRIRLQHLFDWREPAPQDEETRRESRRRTLRSVARP